MTEAEERALPLLRDALSILLLSERRDKYSKTTEDYVRRAANRITMRLHREQEEPSENAHVTEEPFVFVASSIKYGNVDGQRVLLEDVWPW